MYLYSLIYVHIIIIIYAHTRYINREKIDRDQTPP